MKKYPFYTNGEGRSVSQAASEHVHVDNHRNILTPCIQFEGPPRSYAVFTDFDTLVRHLKSLPEYAAHEVVPGGHRQRPKFDIDGGDERTYSVILHAIVDLFAELYGVNAYNQMMECDSSSDTKFSRHIIVKGYCFEDENDARAFTRILTQRLPPNIHPHLDSQVNSANHCFRLLGSVKTDANGDRRVKRVLYWGELRDTLVTYTHLDEPLRRLAAPAPAVPAVVIDDAVVRLCVEYAGEDHSYRYTRNGVIVFDRQRESYCEFCQRTHERDHTLYFTVYRGGVYAHCRKKASSTRFVGSTDNTFETSIRHIVLSSHPPALLDRAVVVNFDCPIASMDVDWAPRFIGIRANMKMGKTRLVQRYLESIDATTPVLVVSFRQTFTYDVITKFGGLTLYSDLKGVINMADHPRIVVQVESLHRVRNIQPCVVIIDESESVIEQFSSPTVRHDKKCIAAFRNAVSQCIKCIFMDANLSQRSIDIIARETPVIYNNTYPSMSNDTMRFVKTRAQLTRTILDALERGKRVVVPTNSRRFAEAIRRVAAERLPGIGIALYSSETPEAVKREHFQNVNEKWAAYDLLIYTPTCSAGVSFELQHYDVTCAYFSDRSTGVESCRQSLYRVRCISTNTYYVCIGSRRRSVIASLDDYERYLLHNIEEVLAGEVPFDYDIADGMVSPFKTPAYQIYLQNKYYAQLSKNDFLSRFVLQCMSAGVKIESLPAMDDREISIKLERHARQMDEDRIHAIASARILTRNDICGLFDGRTLTADENNAVDRYRIAKFYGVDVAKVDVDFVRNYDDKRVRDIYTNLSFLIGDRTVNLESLRRYEQNRVSVGKYSTTYPVQRLCVELLETCGFTDLSASIPPTDMTNRLVNVHRLLTERNTIVNQNFRDSNPIEDIQKDDISILRAVNSIFRSQYGFTVKKSKDGKRYPYTLHHIYLGVLFNTPDTPTVNAASTIPLYSSTLHDLMLDEAVQDVEDYMAGEL